MNLQTSRDDADASKQAAAMLTPLQNKLQMAVQQAGTSAKRKSGLVQKSVDMSSFGMESCHISLNVQWGSENRPLQNWTFLLSIFVWSVSLEHFMKKDINNVCI